MWYVFPVAWLVCNIVSVCVLVLFAVRLVPCVWLTFD